MGIIRNIYNIIFIKTIFMQNSKIYEEIQADFEKKKNEFKNDMLDGLPDMLNLKIVSLKSRELIVKDEDGEEITFYTE